MFANGGQGLLIPNYSYLYTKSISEIFEISSCSIFVSISYISNVLYIGQGPNSWHVFI